MPDENILVRYVRNADDRSTGEIAFNDDDRPNLVIGQAGYVTVEELHRLGGFGVILEKTTEQELAKLNIAIPAPVAGTEGDGLNDLDNKELRQTAKDEDVDLSGLRSNEDIVAAIRAKRTAAVEEPEGDASLPATATTSAGTAVTTPGSAAGSGGSTAASGAGGGTAS